MAQADQWDHRGSGPDQGPRSNGCRRSRASGGRHGSPEEATGSEEDVVDYHGELVHNVVKETLPEASHAKPQGAQPGDASDVESGKPGEENNDIDSVDTFEECLELSETDTMGKEDTTQVDHRVVVSNLGQRLSEVAEKLAHEQKTLKETHLKEYEGLPTLQQSLGDTSKLCQEYHETVGQLSGYIGQLRELLSSIAHTIERKLGDEGLYSWIDGPRAHPADVYGQADEKALLARAAEARSVVARAKTDIQKSEEFAASLEAEAAQSAEDARKAAIDAEIAREEAERARVAAAAKAKADEEARRKAEAERKRRELEESKRREEEARKDAEKNRIAGTPEEIERLRKEAERIDPRNWPMMVFSVEPGDLDVPVGCVVRSLPGVLSRDRVEVERVEQLSGVLTLNDNEELVSHIIQVNFDKDIELEQPLAVAIPHCMPRNFAREPVVKVLGDNGTWRELQTQEVVFEDIKDFKFVEARVKTPSTLVVVTRFKREELHVLRKGGKVAPSVDSRITFNFRAGTFKTNTTFTCEVQPVELHAVSDVKHRHAKECSTLIASSPIVNVNFRGKVLGKPVTISIPVPPPPTKAKRPGTARTDNRGDSRRSQHRGSTRPVSAFLGMPKNEEDEGDELQLFIQDASGKWEVLDDVTISQSKNKDVATFELHRTPKQFTILRTRPGQESEALLQMVSVLETALMHRIVQLILRQRSEEPKEVVILGTSVQKSERLQKNLTEEGYDAGPPPSHELIIQEGQIMELRYRGNIQAEEDQLGLLKMVFNSHVRTRLEFTVTEIDRFAQKGIDCYRGFTQVFSHGIVQVEVPVEGEKDKKNSKLPLTKVVWQEGDKLLCEMLVNLPKPEPEAPKPIPRAPLNLKSDGLVDDRLLRALAVDLGDEWRRLAHYLNVKRVRIQALMRNNINGENEKIIYDMLITWAKRVPHSINKVDLLCRALVRCGRFDLAEEIRDKEEDFNRERAQNSRDSYLRKSFIKVAQHGHVVTDWKFLARELGVNEGDLTEIENDYSSMRDRCYQSLMRWRTLRDGEANVDILARHLRKCRYHDVAEQVKLVC